MDGQTDSRPVLQVIFGETTKETYREAEKLSYIQKGIISLALSQNSSAKVS